MALAPLTVVLNVVLVPLLGPIGAAVALLLTMMVGLVTALAMAYRTFGMPLKWPSLLRVLIATGAVTVLGQQFETSGLLLLFELGLLMIIYLAILVGLRELGHKDLKPLAVWKRN